MTRSTQTLTRMHGAAFDFDVVTDTKPARPSAAPEPAPVEPEPNAEARDPSAKAAE